MNQNKNNNSGSNNQNQNNDPKLWDALLWKLDIRNIQKICRLCATIVFFCHADPYKWQTGNPRLPCAPGTIYQVTRCLAGTFQTEPRWYGFNTMIDHDQFLFHHPALPKSILVAVVSPYINHLMFLKTDDTWEAFCIPFMSSKAAQALFGRQVNSLGVVDEFPNAIRSNHCIEPHNHGTLRFLWYILHSFWTKNIRRKKWKQWNLAKTKPSLILHFAPFVVTCTNWNYRSRNWP